MTQGQEVDTATQIWVMSGLITVLVSIILLIFKFSINRLVNRLDALIDNVRILSEKTGVHRTEIEQLRKKDFDQDKRLNKHSERLRKLEIKQGSDE